ncbi:MAG: hypothetical protein JL50_05340 [Peptococcaceae bacterium BICA1-7]|nr:MAG: hypothetical protein JL50_05340 [Peptococcaceae bacterium BICA1-7]HBV96035.1 N-acetyltransferase [Desulfotomaculum sp.]
MSIKVISITKAGLEILLKPATVSDQLLVKNFFLTLSAESLRRRFLSLRKNMLDHFLDNFFVNDSNMELKILVMGNQDNPAEVLAVGQYHTYPGDSLAEIALVVRDDYQNKGIGRELLSYLVKAAKNNGLEGFEAIVQMDNWPMLHLCETIGLGATEKIIKPGVYVLKMYFDKHSSKENSSFKEHIYIC